MVQIYRYIDDGGLISHVTWVDETRYDTEHEFVSVIKLPLICAPGLTQSAWMTGVVANVTQHITSAPLTASSAVATALAPFPISFAHFCALANVRL